jgi:hypothetical protein
VDSGGSIAPAEALDPESPVKDEASAQTPPAASATREATLADLDRLETLTLEDFEADLGSVVLPEGPLSEVDLSRAAGSFVDAFRER